MEAALLAYARRMSRDGAPPEIRTDEGEPRRELALGRAALGLLVGSAVLLALLGAGLLWVRWSAGNVDCVPDGNCEPQYFLGQGLAFIFVVLPGAYLLGCIAIIVAVRRSLRSCAARDRTVGTLGVALVALTLGLTVMFFASMSGGSPVEESYRYNRWIGSVVVGPIIVGAAAVLFGSSGDRGRSSRVVGALLAAAVLIVGSVAVTTVAYDYREKSRGIARNAILAFVSLTDEGLYAEARDYMCEDLRSRVGTDSFVSTRGLAVSPVFGSDHWEVTDRQAVPDEATWDFDTTATWQEITVRWPGSTQRPEHWRVDLVREDTGWKLCRFTAAD